MWADYEPEHDRLPKYRHLHFELLALLILLKHWKVVYLDFNSGVRSFLYADISLVAYGIVVESLSNLTIGLLGAFDKVCFGYGSYVLIDGRHMKIFMNDFVG